MRPTHYLPADRGFTACGIMPSFRLHWTASPGSVRCQACRRTDMWRAAIAKAEGRS